MSDNIQHVILLALENRSFDQMLGSLNAENPDIDGVSSSNANQGGGKPYPQHPTVVRQLKVDPRHEQWHVERQLAGNNGGFVEDLIASYPKSSDPDLEAIMGYYAPGFLPALHALARDFTICDRWFSSVPGPTWTNRFFLLSGTSRGRVAMPGDDAVAFRRTTFSKLTGWFLQRQDTLFDRLTEKGIHWKSYFHDVPPSSMLVHQWWPHNAARYFYIDEFFRDARGAEEDFPQFSFIEPDFMGIDQNDDHPPLDVMKGERLIAEIYNAIRANPRLWETTLFIVLFDEHGGFYDHVLPPEAVCPDEHTEEYTFDKLGVRVPALLISPWVDRRVEKTQFDHTSVLKYLIEKWGLGPLGDRTAQANSIGVALQRKTPRAEDDCVSRIELTQQQLRPPDPELAEDDASTFTGHKAALRDMAAFLKAKGTSVAVTRLPQFISVLARGVEYVKGLPAAAFAAVAGGGDLKVSLTRPDRIARKTITAREDFAHHLMNAKKAAPAALEKRLSDTDSTPEQREHDIRTLALITRRRFHREENRHANVDTWFRKYGIRKS
jgi:phospholipase C